MSVKPILNRAFNDHINDSDRFKDMSQFIYEKNSILFKEYCNNRPNSTDLNTVQPDGCGFFVEFQLNSVPKCFNVCCTKSLSMTHSLYQFKENGLLFKQRLIYDFLSF
ncbi:hypothetical protein BpHYR1_039462 [Brachionus plicatilis]|uniref:Uncharacterized protein n=1 Tax=Brachionus plicatilis TaxID=10195 RepID=A0A3M7P9P0_BRAPC|nr:hypothetical protein BpHYR1_039462 [Brachionus plicatilis]